MVLPEGLDDWQNRQHHGQEIPHVCFSIHQACSPYHKPLLCSVDMTVMSLPKYTTDDSLECKSSNLSK